MSEETPEQQSQGEPQSPQEVDPQSPQEVDPQSPHEGEGDPESPQEGEAKGDDPGSPKEDDPQSPEGKVAVQEVVENLKELRGDEPTEEAQQNPPAEGGSAETAAAGAEAASSEVASPGAEAAASDAAEVVEGNGGAAEGGIALDGAAVITEEVIFQGLLHQFYASDLSDITKIQSLFRGSQGRAHASRRRQDWQQEQAHRSSVVDPITFPDVATTGIGSEDASGLAVTRKGGQGLFHNVDYSKVSITSLSEDTVGMQDVYCRMLKTRMWW
jgi:hypothetical protein